jgi:hypothetical protein
MDYPTDHIKLSTQNQNAHIKLPRQKFFQSRRQNITEKRSSNPQHESRYYCLPQLEIDRGAVLNRVAQMARFIRIVGNNKKCAREYHAMNVPGIEV